MRRGPVRSLGTPVPQILLVAPRKLATKWHCDTIQEDKENAVEPPCSGGALVAGESL